MRRVLRAVMTTAVACAIWLVVVPARASAPLCDTRGATMFAPAPTLQAPLASIDVSSGESEECPSADLLAAYRQGHERGPRIDPEAPAQAVPTSPRCTVASPRAQRVTTRASEHGSRPGVRSSVERPPRG